MQAKIIPIRKDYRDKIIKSKPMKTVMIVILLLLISFFYCKDGNGVGYFYKNSITDTTKPIIHKYVLKGSDTMFILLQNLILYPDDVTPRQKTTVINWFQNNIRIDSSIKK